MFVPFDYIVLKAVHYGMSTQMALCLVPIMNGARYVTTLFRVEIVRVANTFQLRGANCT